MAFKEVQSLDADNTTALGGFNKKTGKKNPTNAEGYYLGTRQVDSPRSKSGKSALHFLQTPKGNLGVWGKTDLDRKLSNVPAGTMVRITQSGTVPTPNGDMYKFKVEVDPDNTIEVAAPESAAFSGSEEDDNYASPEETEDYGQDEYQAEEAGQIAALSALERRAKVEALLKGKGKRN